MTLPSNFNDVIYLRIHPDVRAAGLNAQDHYLQHGRKEGRSYIPSSRREKILSFVDPFKLGAEIGPSHSPICPKSAGYKVEIIDHLNQNDLKEKYAGHGVDLSAIEHVDHVWKGESYSELTKRPHGYSWVVASHVVEHSPDLVRFLQGCDDILQNDGALVLAIPDKRYCFDHLRAKTSLAAVIDAFEAKRTIHSVGTAAEYYLNVCKIEEGKDWETSTAKHLQMLHSLPEALSSMQAIRASQFLDLHSWCFTPSSFRLMVLDLAELGLIKSREVGFFDTTGHEFIVALGRKGAGPEISRLELAKKSLKE